MPTASTAEARVELGALFFGFLQVGLCAFGGGLVWLRRLVVERRRWLGDGEFLAAGGLAGAFGFV
jgi:chromate transporter